MSTKIGINGFGRIGRLVFRAAFSRPDIEVAAVNDLGDIHALAHLLQYDTVHGKMDAVISCGEDHLIVNGKKSVYSETLIRHRSRGVTKASRWSWNPQADSQPVKEQRSIWAAR